MVRVQLGLREPDSAAVVAVAVLPIARGRSRGQAAGPDDDGVLHEEPAGDAVQCTIAGRASRAERPGG
jgi:hypothetical protein